MNDGAILAKFFTELLNSTSGNLMRPVAKASTVALTVSCKTEEFGASRQCSDSPSRPCRAYHGKQQPREAGTAKWKVKSMEGGNVADDGSTVDLHVRTESGKSHVLVLRYEHFNWLLQALLEMSNALYDRQVKHGRIPGGTVADAAMIAEGFQVPVNHKKALLSYRLLEKKMPTLRSDWVRFR